MQITAAPQPTAIMAPPGPGAAGTGASFADQLAPMWPDPSAAPRGPILPLPAADAMAAALIQPEAAEPQPTPPADAPPVTPQATAIATPPSEALPQGDAAPQPGQTQIPAPLPAPAPIPVRPAASGAGASAETARGPAAPRRTGGPPADATTERDSPAAPQPAMVVPLMPPPAPPPADPAPAPYAPTGARPRDMAGPVAEGAPDPAIPSQPAPAGVRDVTADPALPSRMPHDPGIAPPGEGTAAPAPHPATLSPAPPLAGPSPAPAMDAARPAPVPEKEATASRPTPAAQLAPALIGMVQMPAGGQRLTLRLDPAELGHVQVRIDRTPDAPARVEITVQRPETLMLLLRDQNRLQHALDQAGVPPEGRAIAFHLAPPDVAPVPTGDQTGAFSSGTRSFEAGAGSAGHESGGGMGRQGRGPGSGAGTAAEPDLVPVPRAWLRAGLDITA